MLSKIKYFFSIFKAISFKDTSDAIVACDVLLFCHDVNRALTLNGQAYSPLLDSVKEEIESSGFSSQTIAHPWSSIVGDLAYGNPIAVNKGYLIAIIMDKIFKRFSHKSFSLKFYEDLICLASPKVIITIGCNDEICEASRRLGVFHIELLHGIGYTPIPWGWGEKKKNHLPQGILTFDRVSTDTFSELERHGVLVREASHPFLVRFNKSNICDLPMEWRSIPAKSGYEKEVLISLQWGYADGIDASDEFGGILKNGLFYDELEEVVRQTESSVFWRIRFHPVQYRQRKKYRKLFEFIEGFTRRYQNCEWKESTFVTLPSVLVNCSGHITMNSMASYEAAYLGVPTLALCPSLRGGKYEHLFDDLVDKGFMVKQEISLCGILTWVANVERRQPLLSSLESCVEHDNVGSIVKWLRDDLKVLPFKR